jgi:hypothetical protein
MAPQPPLPALGNLLHRRYFLAIFQEFFRGF